MDVLGNSYVTRVRFCFLFFRAAGGVCDAWPVTALCGVVYLVYYSIPGIRSCFKRPTAIFLMFFLFLPYETPKPTVVHLVFFVQPCETPQKICRNAFFSAFVMRPAEKTT